MRGTQEHWEANYVSEKAMLGTGLQATATPVDATGKRGTAQWSLSQNPNLQNFEQNKMVV